MFRVLLLPAFVSLIFLVPTCRADSISPTRRGCLRTQDQMWVISSRCLGCPSPDPHAVPALQVKRFEAGRWTATDLGAFLSADDSKLTVIFAHGTRSNYSQSIQTGWLVYRQIARGASSDEPIRFVIWSWPATQGKGLVKDFRVKLARTYSDAYYLGWVLHRLPATTRVSLIGHSFGTSVVTGATHALAGGSILGRRLDLANVETVRPRLVLWAAAQNRWSLAPGSSFGQAVDQADAIMLHYNSCDFALKRYPRIDCSGAEALGYTGLCGVRSATVRQRNVCCLIGKSHADDSYLCSGTIMADTRQYALWHNVIGL